MALPSRTTSYGAGQEGDVLGKQRQGGAYTPAH